MSTTEAVPANDVKIRGAMERLLAGQPLHSDGRLTVKNLALEAGLSRQQVYRSALLEEFNEHLRRIAERGEAPTERHLQTIARLRQQLAEEKERSARYRVERDEARRQQETLANQVRLFDEQNRRLEGELGNAGRVAVLRPGSRPGEVAAEEKAQS